MPPERPAKFNHPAPSAESRAAHRYFAYVQDKLKSEGLMRTDGAPTTPADAPYTAADLATNFIHIALYDEYATEKNGQMVARQTPSRLRRWVAPVRMKLHFGPTIPETERIKDRRDVGAYAARLGRVSGHPVALTTGASNFDIYVLNEDERRGFGPFLERHVPGITPEAVRTITDMPRTTYCLVFAFSKGDSAVYERAVAVIRGEHPDALRLLCYHEELAQGLGLANDWPKARPSIFNDDEEFALLTTQDELMLKMLYDPRLSIGMTPTEATPIVRRLAAQLMPGDT
ncbi:DUF2927 domain-containing protein [Acidimangrovimonas sediminis]|uniref:DUF2927 domain-containing protein n=1 Tax=Acidimangrovimonas sediminis TaxID=2056283 RepID=UPI0011AF900C|nr:DUF2927 domain-containing protein [Acidimangrovimonas sediminis]